MDAAPKLDDVETRRRVATHSAGPIPVLHVRMEQMLRRGAGFDRTLEQIEVPVLELSYRYADVTVRASDPCERVWLASSQGLFALERSRAREADARRALERAGAVEIGCLESHEPSFGSRADYVMAIDGDAHAYCSFGAHTLSELRAQGWEVVVDPSYPYRVLDGDLAWYAEVSRHDELEDWFNLELGITIEGRRLNLLPALLALLDKTREGGSLAGLMRIASRSVALPVDEHAYVAIPTERLAPMLAVLRDMYDPRRRNAGALLTFHPRDAAQLASLDAAVQTQTRLSWRGGHELRSIGRALLEGPREKLANSAIGLCATLRPYQRQGVAWLDHLALLGMGGVLADDMGLGKTLQTIAHLLARREREPGSAPALVVAPTSVVGIWAREIGRFAPTLRVLPLHGLERHHRFDNLDNADVAITSYALLWRDLPHFEDRRFSTLVLDEAQAIKNGASRAHRASCSLVADQRIALTGTPMENNLDELHAIFDFVMPGLLGSALEFRTRYRWPIEQGDDERLDQLRRRIAPFVLRRMKGEVAQELPPKTEVVRRVELSGAQRDLYESIRIAAHADVRKIIRAKGLAASTVPVLDALLKLRQVCCDPRLVRVPEARNVDASAKLDVLLSLLRQLVGEGRKVLVFSQFTSMLALVSESLLERGMRHLTLTGATTNRQQRIDAFQDGGADVFLISLKAGGTGLTLTRADTVIHYDPWWNPAAQAQATDRAYRIGQTKPVFVYKLIVAGSVEERMLELQRQKRELADAILAGSAVPRVLEPDMVDELFAPLVD